MYTVTVVTDIQTIVIIEVAEIRGATVMSLDSSDIKDSTNANPFASPNVNSPNELALMAVVVKSAGNASFTPTSPNTTIIDTISNKNLTGALFIQQPVNPPNTTISATINTETVFFWAAVGVSIKKRNRIFCKTPVNANLDLKLICPNQSIIM